MTISYPPVATCQNCGDIFATGGGATGPVNITYCLTCRAAKRMMASHPCCHAAHRVAPLPTKEKNHAK